MPVLSREGRASSKIELLIGTAYALPTEIIDPFVPASQGPVFHQILCDASSTLNFKGVVWTECFVQLQCEPGGGNG
jgi:hypothetical protein